jgi:quercetin dioxygenase-like cupin family protein
MTAQAGYEIVRAAGIPWEDRKNVDGWPSRAGMYWDDQGNQLCMRLIDYPVGAIEPRHVHGGAHATTVLKGKAIVDGLTLGPLDVMLGPSNEPHGPLNYPDGCKLFSVFHGSYHHSEVQKLSTEKHYRLIQSGQIEWRPAGTKGCDTKTLVDRGVGRLLLQAQRFAPGARFAQPAQRPVLAGLVVEGAVAIGDETLGAWDFFYAPADGKHGAITFPKGATLLTVTLQ